MQASYHHRVTQLSKPDVIAVIAPVSLRAKRGPVLRATLAPFTPVRRLNVDASLV
jgi:hypothetical protein